MKTPTNDWINTKYTDPKNPSSPLCITTTSSDEEEAKEVLPQLRRRSRPRKERVVVTTRLDFDNPQSVSTNRPVVPRVTRTMGKRIKKQTIRDLVGHPWNTIEVIKGAQMPEIVMENENVPPAQPSVLEKSDYESTNISQDIIDTTLVPTAETAKQVKRLEMVHKDLHSVSALSEMVVDSSFKNQQEINTTSMLNSAEPGKTPKRRPYRKRSLQTAAESGDSNLAPLTDGTQKTSKPTKPRKPRQSRKQLNQEPRVKRSYVRKQFKQLANIYQAKAKDSLNAADTLKPVTAPGIVPLRTFDQKESHSEQTCHQSSSNFTTGMELEPGAFCEIPCFVKSRHVSEPVNSSSSSGIIPSSLENRVASSSSKSNVNVIQQSPPVATSTSSEIIDGTPQPVREPLFTFRRPMMWALSQGRSVDVGTKLVRGEWKYLPRNSATESVRNSRNKEQQENAGADGLLISSPILGSKRINHDSFMHLCEEPETPLNFSTSVSLVDKEIKTKPQSMDSAPLFDSCFPDESFALASCSNNPKPPNALPKSSHIDAPSHPLRETTTMADKSPIVGYCSSRRWSSIPASPLLGSTVSRFSSSDKSIISPTLVSSKIKRGRPFKAPKSPVTGTFGGGYNAQVFIKSPILGSSVKKRKKRSVTLNANEETTDQLFDAPWSPALDTSGGDNNAHDSIKSPILGSSVKKRKKLSVTLNVNEASSRDQLFNAPESAALGTSGGGYSSHNSIKSPILGSSVKKRKKRLGTLNVNEATRDQSFNAPESPAFGTSGGRYSAYDSIKSPILGSSVNKRKLSVTLNANEATRDQQDASETPVKPAIIGSTHKKSSDKPGASRKLFTSPHPTSLAQSLKCQSNEPKSTLASVKLFDSSSSSKSPLLGSGILEWCQGPPSSISSPNIIPSSYEPQKQRPLQGSKKSSLLGSELQSSYQINSVSTSPILDAITKKELQLPSKNFKKFPLFATKVDVNSKQNGNEKSDRPAEPHFKLHFGNPTVKSNTIISKTPLSTNQASKENLVSGKASTVKRVILNQSEVRIPSNQANDHSYRAESMDITSATEEYNNFRLPKIKLVTQHPEDYNISVYADTLGLTPVQQNIERDSCKIDTMDMTVMRRERQREEESIIECFSSQGETLSQQISASPIKTISDIPSPPSSVHNIAACSSQNDENTSPRCVNMDSAKKKKRPKKGSYGARLQMALARKKSAERILQHELKNDDGTKASKCFNFRVYDICIEFAHVFVHCHYLEEDADEANREPILLMLDPKVHDTKNILFNSVIKMFPPWNCFVADQNVKLYLNIAHVQTVDSSGQSLPREELVEEVQNVVKKYDCLCTEDKSSIEKCSAQLPNAANEALKVLFDDRNNFQNMSTSSMNQLPGIEINEHKGTITDLIGSSNSRTVFNICVLRVFSFKRSEDVCWSLLGKDPAGALCEVIVNPRQDSATDLNDIVLKGVYRLSGFRVTKRNLCTSVPRLWSVIESATLDHSSRFLEMYVYGISPASDVWDVRILDADAPILSPQPTISSIFNELGNENSNFNVLVKLLHFSENNQFYVTDTSLTESSKPYAVILPSPSVIIPAAAVEKSAILLLTDVQLSKGMLTMDKYSRILTMTDAKRCGLVIARRTLQATEDILPIVGPIRLESCKDDLVGVRGIVTGVVPNSGNSWQVCYVCEMPHCKETKPGKTFCSRCNEVTPTKTKLALTVDVACAYMHNVLIKVMLLQPSIENLLPSPDSNTGKHNKELVLGREIGPLMCRVLQVDVNTSNGTRLFIVEEVG